MRKKSTLHAQIRKALEAPLKLGWKIEGEDRLEPLAKAPTFDHVCLTRGLSALSLGRVATVHGLGTVRPVAEFAEDRGVELTMLSRRRVARELGLEATARSDRREALEAAAALAAGPQGMAAIPEYRARGFGLLIARRHEGRA